MRPSLFTVWLLTALLAGPSTAEDREPRPVRIAIIGDSTVASYASPPADRPDLTGWGQVLGEWFPDHVQVSNHAVSGRSSKSFLREGRWPKVLADKPDYVFIQFGHNDQPGKGDRTTDPDGDFQDNLKQYVREARQAGARPILVTPVARRIFQDGRPTSTLGPYVDAMQKVGRESQTPVIDLHAASLKLFGDLGDDGSAPLSASSTDRSHFSRKGALAIARLVVEALPQAAPELAAHVKKPNGKQKDAGEHSQTHTGSSMLDLALEPPTINTQPGPEYDDRVRVGNMVIGIERTLKGRLWACWVGNGDSPNGFFMLATSDDGGASWSKPRVVIDPTDPPGVPQRRALVGNLWTDPLGRLWCFFDQSLGYFDGRCGDWYIRCDDPDAARPVWTSPVRFADGCTLNKPTVLANGDWLLPVSLWTRDRIGPAMLKDAHKNLDAGRMASVFASTDQGKSWARRGGVAFPGTDFDEHMIVELKDGRLWMLARTRQGISESFSSDHGATWGAPQASAIRNVSARFFIRRLASGNLLLVKNGPIDIRLPRRSSLTAYVSADEGQTWSRGLVLDDRAEVSYPDGIQSPDGTIHLVYDWNRHTDAEILLAKFREEDVLDGTFASPGAKSRLLVNKAYAPKLPKSIVPDPKWTAQAAQDAQQDFSSIPYDGVSPNKMVCDTTLREMTDGSWALFLLAGDDFEPSPKNYTGITRSTDRGKTWTPLEPMNTNLPRSGSTTGQCVTEVIVREGRCLAMLSTHSQTWGRDWRTWFITSEDNGRTWGQPQPAPGRLARFTFLRNHVVTRDGRLLVPTQHYLGPAEGTPAPPPEDKPWHAAMRHYVSNPRNGVLASSDGGRTWSQHGDLRLTPDDRYHGWVENNIVELADGRIAMILRADRLGGVLYYAESKDGGRTWPDYASVTRIPNPGSKATLYSLGGDVVALLHNPNSKHRSPLALWISFDGMKTWPYQRVLYKESCDGPQGRLNYPDGFVSADKQWLHFAFDDNRHRAVHYSAKLPPLDHLTPER